jgi:polyhydroxybutyrate depolymerase
MAPTAPSAANTIAVMTTLRSVVGRRIGFTPKDSAQVYGALVRWLFLALAACGGSTTPPPTQFGTADRPVTLQIPDGYDSGKHYPLIMVLHGYSASGFVQEAYFGTKAEVTAGNAFVVAPDGLIDSNGDEYWNADPGCCDFDHANPDDSGYLGGILDAVTAAYPIDHVWLIGHSNGGYMAYRMACDHADIVENIIVLAGDAATDPSACNPVKPVEVLHLHGDMDTEVPYAEAAMRSVDQWAMHDTCAQTSHAGPTYDLDASVPGAETMTQIFDGCPTGIDLELWTLVGSGHVPSLTPTFEPTAYQWFLDHVRP